MNCDQAKLFFAEHWSGTLPDQEEIELERHLGSCEACRAEAERLAPLWSGLASLPSEEPGPDMRGRFYETLAAYRDGAATAKTSAHRPLRLVWQIAAGVALLVAGGGAGYAVRGQSSGPSELAQLRGEVNSMRQLVALSLLQQQSASERLRGVSWAYRVESSDTEVLSALVSAVNHDPNINVRLAAVDALHPFAGSATTRDAVLQSLPRQSAPIVQVALIDLLVDLKERDALKELERMVSDSSIDSDVRQHAQWALEKLQ
ncbi:MAG TPA: HEAT repeat domain-containing protein [Bryobacteraceae bacterium]|jgi:anti-sigma factor RsiW